MPDIIWTQASAATAFNFTGAGEGGVLSPWHQDVHHAAHMIRTLPIIQIDRSKRTGMARLRRASRRGTAANAYGPGMFTTGAGSDEARKPCSVAAQGGIRSLDSTAFYDVVAALPWASFFVPDSKGAADIPGWHAAGKLAEHEPVRVQRRGCL